MSLQQRLAELGIELPHVPVPVANYAPAGISGGFVYTSVQLPVVDGELVGEGKVGESLSLDDAAQAARVCALNALAAAAEAAGGVDKLARAVKVTGFVASAPDFFSQPQVINGASDLLGEVFGTAHARAAVGVNALPMNAPVEVEAIFELA